MSRFDSSFRIWSENKNINANEKPVLPAGYLETCEESVLHCGDLLLYPPRACGVHVEQVNTATWSF